MQTERWSVRPAVVLFAFGVGGFAFILMNGYALNLLGLPANALWVIGLMLLEFAALSVWLARSVRVSGDPLELIGFLLVVAGTWLYFLIPSLPTFLPPSFSGDAANLLAQANAVFATGRIISDYPGGVALTTATIAHWTGLLPFRVEHPIAALWAALTAGGIYIIACAMLPARREFKTIALVAPLALFAPWEYFAGMLIRSEYYASQVGAQLFLVAFVLFLVEHQRSRQFVWLIALGLCLLAISFLFQLWLVVPTALWGIAALFEWRKTKSFRSAAGETLGVLGLPTLFWLTIIIAAPRFVPQVSRFGANGAVVDPSLGSLGGAFLILPALGVWLARRSGYRIELIAAWLGLLVAQALLMSVGRLAGLSNYWFAKSFYPLILPLASFSTIPFARVAEWTQRTFRRNPLAATPVFLGTFGALAGMIVFFFPPPMISVMTEGDIQTALWAKEHLDTRHVQYVGRKSIMAQWLGVAFWEEKFPDDLLVDMAALGPKTFEEWRDDPAWGEYLFVSSQQRVPINPPLRVIYQSGDSAIIQKAITDLPAGGPPPAARFGSVFAAGDIALSSESFHAGDVISLNLDVQTADVPASQVVWRLQLRDLQNNAVAEAHVLPFHDQFPLQRWPDKIELTQPLTLSLPFDAPPGLYDLQLGLYYVGSGAALPVSKPDGTQDDVLRVGHVKIAAPPTTTHELASIARLDYQVGQGITLLGYRIPQMTAHPGDPLRIVLYWKSETPVSTDYTVFAHLIDSAGTIAAQQDVGPRSGTYPTSIWEPGEIIVDAHRLSVPRDAAPGDYRIELGMYAWPSLQRLTLTGASTQPVGDHLELPATIHISSD